MSLKLIGSVFMKHIWFPLTKIVLIILNLVKTHSVGAYLPVGSDVTLGRYYVKFIFVHFSCWLAERFVKK